MASIHYLTVQDILWINLQITKKSQPFAFSKLEEATFCQYGYGESQSLVPQAAKFLAGFTAMKPLSTGNEATAFVGCLAFLEINGGEITLNDDSAPAWIGKFNSHERQVLDLLKDVTKEGEAHHHGRPDIRATVQGILERFPRTVDGLAGKERAAAS